MHSDLIGKVIRRHLGPSEAIFSQEQSLADKAKYIDIGLIVHTSADGIWYIALPTARAKKPTAKQSKLSNPRFENYAAFEKLTQSGSWSIVNYEVPPSWRYDLRDLKALAKQQGDGNHVRGLSEITCKLRRLNYKKWLEIYENNRKMVEPIFENYSMRALLEDKLLSTAVSQRATELGCKRQTLQNLVLLRMMGCRTWNSLVPRWSEVGHTGAERFDVHRNSGAKTRVENRQLAPYKRFDMTAQARRYCRLGWVALKDGRTSDRDAFRLTLLKYWPGTHEHSPQGKNYKLLPAGERPSFWQFMHCVSRYRRATTLKIWIDEKFNTAAYKKRISKLRNVGQLGEIDATSEDQTPVSETSRLMVLSSTWRAVYIEVKTGYILGFYSGFEPPSTLTNLLAILHGATDKKYFLARYGKDFPWLHMLCKTISADNGEMKSENGIVAMEELGVSIMFARAWTGQDKATLENNHRLAHQGVDHKLDGTTGGKQRVRGEVSRDIAACRTHRENIINFLDFVDKHNNHDPVPHLVPDEMIADGEKGVTRHAILEWHMKKGYVASEPDDIDSLKKRCLPRFPAQLTEGGVRIFNPLEPETLIKNLSFSGPVVKRMWKGKSRSIEVLLDPTDINKSFLVVDGQLCELARLEANPLQLTLLEHIELQEALKDNVAVGEAARDEFEANRLKNIEDSNRNARGEKKRESEMAAAEDKGASPAPAQGRAGKRANTTLERARQDLLKKGFAPSSSMAQDEEAVTSAGADEIDKITEAQLEAARQLQNFMLD